MVSISFATAETDVIGNGFAGWLLAIQKPVNYRLGLIFVKARSLSYARSGKYVVKMPVVEPENCHAAMFKNLRCEPPKVILIFILFIPSWLSLARCNLVSRRL